MCVWNRSRNGSEWCREREAQTAIDGRQMNALFLFEKRHGSIGGQNMIVWVTLHGPRVRFDGLHVATALEQIVALK